MSAAIATVRERPILFSGDMVKAILDYRKTQTRRVMRPQPWTHLDTGELWLGEYRLDDVLVDRVGACKYRVGDRLWVRETFCDNGGGEYEYKATSLSVAGSWAPSIYMPRAASRITLEITRVRFERLQDIALADVEAEGVQLNHYYCDESGGAFGHRCEPVERFKELWDKINGKRASWESNPWVWVITFKLLEEKQCQQQ